MIASDDLSKEEDKLTCSFRLIAPLVFTFFGQLTIGISYPVITPLLEAFFNNGVSCDGVAAQTSECIDAAATTSLAVGCADGFGAMITFILAIYLGTSYDS